MQIYRYAYAIKNIVITADKNYYVADGSVPYLYIHHDYRTRRMPVVRMNIELDINTIAMIYKHKDKAMIKFDIYEHQYDTEDHIVNTTLYMQHIFAIIPSKDQNNYVTSQDTVTEALVDEMKSLQLFETYLIDMTAVNWFNQQVCTIFENASKPASMQALFQMRGIPGNTLIASPPLDNSVVNYTVLPLGDLIGNIESLNTTYGLYDVRPWIYYDLHYLYCVNWLKPNIVLPTANDFGNIVIMMINPNNAERQISGSYTDLQSKAHYLNLTEMPQINDYSNKINATKFSTVASIDQKGNVDKTTLSKEDTALTYIYAQNNMTVDQVVNENMQGHNVQLQMNNISVSCLRPYKTVTFEADTQFLNLGLTGHEYRIAGWSLSITREGYGENANTIHDVRLSLIKPTTENK